ncbi:transcription elongation factor GreB [Methylomonas sp. AM2-LC]|uniref:transcription elongation factor GreB n=1 Tax=Methylomonas sp. AM2-LC TaxID=3153301 RepID=UPI0032676E34
MSRWRPPQPKSSPYITVDGYQVLETELKQLWERRKLVTIALSAAAAEGDRSENAEYIYRKKELREIDRRIHYLQKRLPALTIVSEKPTNQKQVFFGAWVTLETMEGEEITYRIVGADEIDTTGGLISLDSPLAKALLKKLLDDEVVIRLGEQENRFYIVNIRY